MTTRTSKADGWAAADGGVSGRRIGHFTHQVIASLLEEGLRSPSPAELFERVGSHELVASASRYRTAARQQLLTGAAVYFRLFCPPAGWEFRGSEVKAGGCRLDLVFARDGMVLADEIKAGAMASASDRDALDEQIARQLAAGARKWGAAFAGVRAVLLARPAMSFLAAPDGSRHPLTWKET